MKMRKDFVTNSSSSSYVCDICSSSESGWDMGLSEAEMFQCVNGHTFHESCGNDLPNGKTMLIACITNKIADITESTYYTSEQIAERLLEETTLLAKVNDNNDEDNDDYMDDDDMLSMAYDDYELRYSMPSSVCPICSFGVAQDSDIASYLLTITGQTKETVVAEMKEKFGSYEAFSQFIAGKMAEVESEEVKE
jgi:hypothetical protein